MDGPTTEAETTLAYSPSHGRLMQVTARLGGTDRNFSYMSYQYGSYDRIASFSAPMHSVTSQWWNPLGALSKKENRVGGTNISTYQYGVNPIGQRTNVAATGTAFAEATGWGWQYDGLGQVNSATHVTNTAFHRTYLYDDIGNRKTSSQGPQPGLTTAYTPNLLNQYSAITGANEPPVAPTHDLDGNQLGGAAGPASGQTFEWDGENRLRQVRDAGNNVVVTYTYDAHSRRVAKTTATTRTHALYDGWNLLAEYQATLPGTSAPTLQRSYLWGSDLSGGMQGAGGVGGLLAAQLHTGVNAGVYYPTYDGNGNVSEYLNATGGVAAHYEYGPFGEPLASRGTVAPEMPFRFSTKYQDAETGLYSYIFRPYDPLTGRWLSRDPIGERGGVNLLMYVNNNPVNAFDLLGLANYRLLGAKCCNYSKGAEWAVVGDGQWKQLNKDECTGTCEDCDGMTCHGYFHTPALGVAMLGGLSCSDQPFGADSIVRPTGWTPTNGSSGKSPVDVGVPEANQTPPSYEWAQNRN